MDRPRRGAWHEQGGAPAIARFPGARRGSGVRFARTTSCDVDASPSCVPELCPPMTRDETISALVDGTNAADLPALAGELARALGIVLVRAAAPARLTAVAASQISSSPLLTVDQAADRLGVTRSWLYRHAKRLPFTRKIGHRTLRFDAPTLERWRDTRRPH
jgi:excisionase family DNA binding protein